jgi:hypothetical protein
LIREKILKKRQRSGKPFLFEKGWHWRYVSINSMTLPSVHSISQLQKRPRNDTTLQIRTTLQDRDIRNEKKVRGPDGGDVSCIIPLMRRSNTDNTPNKPVTLPRN